MSILPKPSVCIGVFVLFFAATVVTYGSTLGNEFVTWDDMGLIAENKDVQNPGFASVKHVFSSYDPELYIPLTFVSYQVNHLTCGNESLCYHATDLLIHTLNAAFVALILYALFGEAWLAIGLGLLFALHPLNTETVVWASARKDTLSTFFFLTSLVTYIAWRSDPKARWYWISIALFLLGLLSKVMIVTLPIVLLLLDYAEHRTDWKKMLLEKIPFFILSGIFGIVALFGKSTILVSSTWSDKILMAAKSTLFYLVKFVLPSDLSVMVPYTQIIRFSSSDFWLPMVLVAILAGLCAFWIRRHKTWPAFGLLFFIITLLPTFINFSKGGDLYVASDRYAYIPMIGLLVLIADTASRWMYGTERKEVARTRRKTLGGVGVVVLLLCAYAAHAQAKTWANSTSLYEQVLSVYPNARAAHNNLGMEHLQAGRYNDALTAFDRSLAVRSDPRTIVNRAAALAGKGDTAAAQDAFLLAIKLAPELPDGYYGIGNIHYKQGKLPEAEIWYRKALEAKPTYTNALNNLGAVELQLQDWDGAIATLSESIRVQPDFATSYYNLGWAYENKQMFTEAEAMYGRAVDLSPNDADALSSLASVLYRRKAIDEAAILLKRALTLDGSNPIAIGVVMQMKKDGVAE